MKEKDCCKFKTTPRNPDNVKDILKRLNRVSGQISGIKKMVESERYCVDIMIQLSACEKALVSIGDIILKEHMETCFVEGIQNKNDEMIAETLNLIKIMR